MSDHLIVEGNEPTPEIVIESSGVSLTVQDPPAQEIVVSYNFPNSGSGGSTPSFQVNTVNKVDRSLVYYDAAQSQFRADDVVTTDTITDGGNF